MKKYKGNRHINDIKFHISRRGGLWDDSAYKQGSDFQSFQFIPRSGFGVDGLDYVIVCYGVFGRFIIRDEKLNDNQVITERSSHLDGTPWYDELLDILYTSEQEAA